MQIWSAHDGRHRREEITDEFQIETDVRAAGVVGELVKLRGKHVRAVDQQRRVHGHGEEPGLVRANDIRRREGQIADVPRGHVGAEDFHAVEIEHCAVVAQETCRQVGELRSVRHREGAAETGRDELLLRVGSEADDGRLRPSVARIAVAQLGCTGGPCRVIKPDLAPRVALVRASVEILPDFPGEDEPGGAEVHRDVHGRGGGHQPAVVGGDGGKRVIASGHVEQRQSEGRNRVLTQLVRAIEELDARDESVAVHRRRLKREADRGLKHCAVRGVDERDRRHRINVRVTPRSAGPRRIEVILRRVEILDAVRFVAQLKLSRP